MRLLTCIQNQQGEVIGLQLKQYSGTSIPPYAILSHRWGPDGDEVSFKDLDEDLPAAKHKKGFAKISNCCLQAQRDGFNHVWVDTCCIDKSSSAELSEGINSMYAWYSKSRICYAYLEDVPSDQDPRAAGSAFRKSVWFTRGWTLQELIAPTSVVFLAGDWVEIGSKASLSDAIEEITRIDRKVLVRTSGFKVSIAMRMSWAANRQTARVEDRAYSLLGIFGVNMPAIYGEGARAFKRLQNEILRVSNDHSIFAWQGHAVSSGMLASSPDQFANSMEFDSMRYEDFARFFEIEVPQPDYALTNFGLRIQLPMIEFRNDNGDKTKNFLNAMEGILPASLGKASWSGRMFVAFIASFHGKILDFAWIFLTQSPGQQEGHFVRTAMGPVATSHGPLGGNLLKAPIQQVVIRDEEDPSVFETLEASVRQNRLTYRFVLDLSGCSTFEATATVPGHFWVEKVENNTLLLVNSNLFGAIMLRSTTTGERVAAVIGVHNWRVWSDLVLCTDDISANQVYNDYNRTNNGKSSGRCWLGLDWVSVPRGRWGGSFLMTVRKGEDVTENQALYVVKIATRQRMS